MATLTRLFFVLCLFKTRLFLAFWPCFFSMAPMRMRLPVDGGYGLALLLIFDKK
jgi:hypothetical protein